jgi:hypothetical protein
MRKLIPLFLLSVSGAFGQVVFDAGEVTVDLSDTSTTATEITLDQWVTTAGPVQSGFLWIHDLYGGSTDDNTITSVSIGGIVTGHVFNNLELSAPDEIPYAAGFFVVPFTLGEPFEIKAQIDLLPFGPPNDSFSSAGVDLQFSIDALTGGGTLFTTTGSEAIEPYSPSSVPEPGTIGLFLAAAAMLVLPLSRRALRNTGSHIPRIPKSILHPAHAIPRSPISRLTN